MKICCGLCVCIVLEYDNTFEQSKNLEGTEKERNIGGQ